MRKRPRLGVDIDTLSEEERAIVARAADILQVPLENVPVAVSRLHRSSGPIVETPRNARPQIKQRMGPPSRNPMSRATTSKSANREIPPVNGDVLNSDKPVPKTSLSSSFCNLDSYIGFGTMSNRWSDCFASFSPQEPSSRLDTGYGTFASSTRLANQCTDYVRQ